MKVVREDLEFIIHELRDANEQAMAHLFDELFQPLKYFAFQYVKNSELAEEIVLDSLMKVWEKRTVFTSFSQLKSFLYVCTKHDCLNHIRSFKRQPIQYFLDDLENLHFESDEDFIKNLIQSEVLNHIHKQVDELPTRQKDVFILTFMEDLNSEEISKRLNISLESVYSNKSRAISFLKNRVNINLM